MIEIDKFAFGIYCLCVYLVFVSGLERKKRTHTPIDSFELYGVFFSLFQNGKKQSTFYRKSLNPAIER